MIIIEMCYPDKLLFLLGRGLGLFAKKLILQHTKIMVDRFLLPGTALLSNPEFWELAPKGGSLDQKIDTNFVWIKQKKILLEGCHG